MKLATDWVRDRTTGRLVIAGHSGLPNRHIYAPAKPSFRYKEIDGLSMREYKARRKAKLRGKGNEAVQGLQPSGLSS